MTRFIGIDMGGTNLRAGIVEVETGKVLALRSVPTLAREGQDAVIARITSLIDSLVEASDMSPAGIAGVGIGCPAVLDIEQGVILFMPNLPGRWHNVPLRDLISSKTGLPVYLLNDVRARTLAEWTFGAGQGVDTMACFSVGTGIGGGLIINRQLHLGIDGSAGELGHQTIDMNGPVCGCGNRGCLEALASGPAIAAMGMKAVSQGLRSTIGSLVNYALNKITPELICEAARQGDRVAREIYERAGNYIGIAVANVLVSIGPRKVVIGGGVAAAGDLLLDPIRRTVQERVTVMPVAEVEIVLASLGADAGVIGVALWAMQRMQAENKTVTAVNLNGVYHHE